MVENDQDERRIGLVGSSVVSLGARLKRRMEAQTVLCGAPCRTSELVPCRTHPGQRGVRRSRQGGAGDAGRIVARWIKFGAGIRTGFATAHSIPPSDDWMRINDLVGTVVNRTRLLHLLDQSGVVANAPWMDAIKEFVGEQLVAIRSPEPDDPKPRTRKPKRNPLGPDADPRAR